MNASQNLKLSKTIKREDLKAVLDVYTHPCNARVIRIKNDDPEKYFTAVFRTKVSDSTGVPHILEHSVLSGSKKYPLSDPFVTLLKTSMPTFLNAMTYPDKTLYPVGSANFRDFMNLSDVYLDTCFAPLLTQETFEREGWRYEFNEDEELIFQGVVYNEMKGVYSDIERYVVDDGLLSEIYPDNEYSHISGGNPENITDLTYQQFKDFYAHNYHPANSIILIYGDMNEGEEKECLNNVTSYLDQFQSSKLLPIVTRSQDYKTRRFVHKTYQAEEGSKNVYTNIVYRMENTIDATCFSLLLEYFLNDTRECYQEIQKTGLVERFVHTGVELDLVQPYFGMALELKQADKSTTIQDIFEKHIKEAIKNGLDKEYLKGLINKMEYAYIESLDHNGFGIINEFARRFGKDEEFLDINYYDILEEVKAIVTDDNKVNDLFNRVIINNVNNVIVEFLPDTQFNQVKQKEESQKLKVIQTKLDDAAIATIKTKSEIIAKGKKEDESVIPRLALKDLPQTLKLKEVEIEKGSNFNLVHVKGLDKQTSIINMVFMVDSKYDKAQLGYLDLFFSKFFTFGTDQYSEHELEVALKQTMGSLSSSINMRLDGVVVANVSVGYLTYKQKEVLELLHQLFGNRNCDSRDILKNLIDSTIGQLQYTIKNESDEIISEKLNMSIYDTIYYDYNSLAVQEKFLNESKKEIENNYSEFITKINKAFELFKTNLDMSISFLGEAAKLKEIEKFGQELSSQFNGKAYRPTPTVYKLKPFDNTLIEYQSNEIVNYHRQAIRTDGLDINDGLMYLMCRIMTYEYGWTEVRSKGGAYGVRINYNEPNGLITALTYRDPRSKENYNLITDSLKFITTLDMDDEKLESFKIATSNGYMPYRNTESEFFFLTRNYFSGRNDNEHLNKVYKQLLETTVQDLQRAAKMILDKYEPMRAVSHKMAKAE
jgi:presequence protease